MEDIGPTRPLDREIVELLEIVPENDGLPGLTAAEIMAIRSSMVDLEMLSSCLTVLSV